MNHIEGSFTHRFRSLDEYDSVYRGILEDRDVTYTVTMRFRARWWKRPLLWLRRKPSRWERTLTGVRFGEFRFGDDNASVSFQADADA